MARRLDDGKTLEILRVCTDGTPNTCSFLYGRGQLMAYTRILIYTLAEEAGASLWAVGAEMVGKVEPKEWSVPSRKRKSQGGYGKAKVKWEW